MNSDPYFTPCTKISLKLIKNLNIRAETIDLLEENTREKLHELAFGNDFLYMTSRAQATKEKNR